MLPVHYRPSDPALTALAVQNSGHRLGLLNPRLYSDYGTSVFEDVKGNPPEPAVVRADFVNSVDSSAGIVYSVRELNQDSSLKVTKGWDDATGLGVPTTAYFNAFSGS